MSFTQHTEKNIYWIFLASVFLKGAHAVIEIALGTLFLFTNTVTSIVVFLTQQELLEDPNDFLALRIDKFIPYLSPHTQSFFAFYLLSHGLVKIFLVWGLLKNKLWAYPASIIFLVLFIIYQLVRYTSTHSVFLILLTIFDIFVIWLVVHEYKRLKSKSL